jgi:hypothetical protein
VRVEQQDHGGVDPEQVEDPIEQLLEQVVDVESRKCGVGDGFEAPEALIAVGGRFDHANSVNRKW